MQTHLNKRGRMTVQVSHQNKQTTLQLSRLVALAFIPNPNNLPEVDHINRNSADNRVENLRWVDKVTNMANRGMPTTNTSGEMHIICRFQVAFTRNKKKTQRYFTTLEDAKAFRFSQLGF